VPQFSTRAHTFANLVASSPYRVSAPTPGGILGELIQILVEFAVVGQMCQPGDQVPNLQLVLDSPQ
jgi:hypothetical protein